MKTSKTGFIRNRPAEIFFGPIRTLRTDAENTQRLNREVGRDLFRKEIKTVDSRKSTLFLTCNDTDTALVTMLVVTSGEIQKRNTTAVILNVGKNKVESTAEESWVDEMIIRFQNDSVQWRYTRNDPAAYLASGYIAKLQSAADSFFVKQVDNFSEKRKEEKQFLVPASGFLFFHQGQQTGALQLFMKRIVWIGKKIDMSSKEAILVTMAALLAASNEGTVQ